ncbi:hypothetical protein IWW55_003018 [Coemansia sp. RSA 2706]|nr:hypothetical protein IWW55_003018 [Coemansia sp. RSA 2706]KAJ2321330.1 hypothetical protein IWW52_000815 [Coemansia sp. RSA 2704]KAJ2383981.1 hypothetical protein H4S02_005036 [Coemansia sp. RSA 2611]
MPEYRIFTVDAFASKAFGGNQAGVVPIPSSQPLPDQTMQALAAEMNIAETAYFTPLEHQGADEFQTASTFNLRWFTPVMEYMLCGHATLAAAHVLFHELHNRNEELKFHTLSGILIVRLGSGGQLDMTFPVDRPLPITANQNHQLLAASVVGEYSDSLEILLSPALNYLLVFDPQMTHEQVAKLEPNFNPEAMAAGQQEDINAVVVTAPGGECDFVSRVFTPWSGDVEDPVTGSAHTVLAPFWAQRLAKTQFAAVQCSARTGHLGVRLNGDQVVISGQAVVVIRGSLSLD